MDATTLAAERAGGLRSQAGAERRVELDPGQIVNGRYVVEARLGEGGMGVVYRARDTLRGDRPVALKTLRGASTTLLAHLRTEFRHLTRLEHPNVAEAYDFEALHGEGESHFFTMEYVEGQDIFRATEGAGWEVVLDYLVQVCRALSYVHSRHLVHYDLKPANVLVDGDGVVRVLDFGVAGEWREGHGQTAGTPEYMAPEMIDRDAAIDHRADLYALGVMAYQLLYREVPFRASSLAELFSKHQLEPVSFGDASHPRWLDDIIAVLCEKRPEERYTTANGVLEAINAAGGFDYALETTDTIQSYIVSSRFVGRRRELRALTELAADRASGRGAHPPMLLVGAQGGGGKSRLMREARREVQLSRLPFVEGRCVEGSLAELGPLAPILEHLARLAEASGRSELLARLGPQLAKVAPDLAEARGLEPSPPAPDAAEEATLLREAVIELFVRVADHQPYVVFVDDLHWAGPALIELLTELTRRVAIDEAAAGRVPMTLLAAYRDDESEGTALEKMLAVLRAEGAVAEMNLEPLREAQVAEVLSSMLGVSELPPLFVSRVAAETAGIPFFVEEVMRALVEQGTVYIEGGAWAAREEVGAIELPATMAAVFRRRAALLDAEARAVLACLATSARPAPAAVLAEATGLDYEALYEALRTLTHRRMAVAARTDEGWVYSVAHDRMRETVYGDLDERERCEHHLALADAIARVYAESGDAHVFDLADHYNSALPLISERSQRDRVAEINERAARKARTAAIFSAEEAYLEAAYRLLPPGAWDDQYERASRIVARAMSAAYLSGRLARGDESFDLLSERARSNLERVYAYVVKMEAYITASRLSEALAIGTEALGLLGVEVPPEPDWEHVESERREGQTLRKGRGIEDLQALEEVRDPRVLAQARILQTMWMPATKLGRLALVGWLSERNLSLLWTSGMPPDGPAIIMDYGLYVTLFRRDLEEGLRYADAAAHTARERARGRIKWTSLFPAAGLFWQWRHPLRECTETLLGIHDNLRASGETLYANDSLHVALEHIALYSDLPTALDAIQTHLPFLQRVNSRGTLAHILGTRQLLRLLAGRTRSDASFDDDDFDEASFLSDLIRLEDAMCTALFYATKIKGLYIMGHLGEALERAREAEAYLFAAQMNPSISEFTLIRYLLSAAACAGADDADRAAYEAWMVEDLENMRAWARLCPANFAHMLALMEGEEARRAGEDERALARYDDGVERARAEGWPLHAALGEELGARLLLSRGEREEGLARLRRAREAYRDYGAAGKARLVDEELA